jgi:TolB-like protein
MILRAGMGRRHEKGLKKDENLRKLPHSLNPGPEMNGASPQVLRFEGHVLDPARRSLTRGGRPITLRPQAMEVLCYLARHPGRAVSKAEIFGAVWPGISVTDDSLAQCIAEIRRVLQDGHRRIIKTVPRLGYLFAGVLSGSEGDEMHSSSGFETARSASAAPLDDRPLLAVTPFSDLSGGPERAGLGDGITEDLITILSRIRWLSVVRGGPAFATPARASGHELVRELGVRYALQGSVRRAADRLRINAHLFDAGTGVCLWSEHYDRRLRERLAVQDEIAGLVAAAIEIQVLTSEGARALMRPADVLRPWEIVARARTHFAKVAKAEAATAIALLEALVEVQPHYAPARSLLGLCLVTAAHMGWIARDQGLPPGRGHAICALELDEGDPWAHIALGYWAMMERRTDESIAAFRQAVQLNPHSAVSHSHLSRCLAFAGRHREAIEHGEEAVRLGPSDPQKAFFLGGIAVANYAAGRFDEAVRWSIEAQRLRPGFQGSRRMLCASLALARRTNEARSLLRLLRRDQPQLSMDWLQANVPYQTAGLIERYQDGMWTAGLR